MGCFGCMGCWWRGSIVEACCDLGDWVRMESCGCISMLLEGDLGLSGQRC